MKKIIALSVFMCLISGSAFAATFTAPVADAGKTLRATADVNSVIGKTSKGVRLAATYNEFAYALMTVHVNGSKYYGTAFDATAIWVNSPAGDINATFAIATSSNAETAFDKTKGWSAL